MSETTTVTDENKKTIIAFIVGLLVGGLLVYVFATPIEKKEANSKDEDVKTAVNSDSDSDKKDDSENDRKASTTSSTSNGSADVDDQSAGGKVNLGDVTFPGEAGWVGVRDYEDGRLMGLLGVARWNKTEGLMPKEISLLRSTVAGKTYAVVFYSDNGDKVFNLATDVQMEGAIATFETK